MFCGEPSSNLRLSAVISTFWSEPGRVKGPEMVATSRSRLKASRSWIRLSAWGQKILLKGKRNCPTGLFAS